MYQALIQYVYNKYGYNYGSAITKDDDAAGWKKGKTKSEKGTYYCERYRGFSAFFGDSGFFPFIS